MNQVLCAHGDASAARCTQCRSQWIAAVEKFDKLIQPTIDDLIDSLIVDVRRMYAQANGRARVEAFQLSEALELLRDNHMEES